MLHAKWLQVTCKLCCKNVRLVYFTINKNIQNPFNNRKIYEDPAEKFFEKKIQALRVHLDNFKDLRLSHSTVDILKKNTLKHKFSKPFCRNNIIFCNKMFSEFAC